MNLGRPIRSAFSMRHRPDHFEPTRLHDPATGVDVIGAPRRAQRARRHWRRNSVIGLTVRLLLATLLVLNGISGASTSVQPCHSSAPQNAPTPFARIANSDYRSVRMVADPAHAQVTHVHGSHPQGMHAHMTLERVQTDGANRRCAEGCCQGMNCTSHCSMPAMIQPAAPRLLMPGAGPSRIEKTAMHAVPRTLAAPDRPPAI